MMSFGNRFSVVAALSLGPAVSNSFARFAYALMLPAMRADLGLNYSQAGALNTANAIGYLGGALFAARTFPRWGTGGCSAPAWSQPSLRFSARD
jgi:predicted MFS family arabinose efflux permease